MSAAGVTDAVVAGIEAGGYDFIVANYANPDMVGHTGVWDATLEALGAVIDASLARIVAAVETADTAESEARYPPRDHRRPRQCRRDARRVGAPVTAHSLDRCRSCSWASRRRPAAGRRRPRRCGATLSSWRTCQPGRPSPADPCCAEALEAACGSITAVRTEDHRTWTPMPGRRPDHRQHRAHRGDPACRRVARSVGHVRWRLSSSRRGSNAGYGSSPSSCWSSSSSSPWRSSCRRPPAFLTSRRGPGRPDTRSHMTRTDTRRDLVALLAILAAPWAPRHPARRPRRPRRRSAVASGPRFGPTVRRRRRRGARVRLAADRADPGRPRSRRAALLWPGSQRTGRHLVPDLAERWTVDASGKTWTVELREDARWHDGTPVTPDDVVFTIETLQDPAYTGPSGTSWSEASVSATGSPPGHLHANDATRRLPAGADASRSRPPISSATSPSRSWPTTRSAGSRSARGLRDRRAHATSASLVPAEIVDSGASASPGSSPDSLTTPLPTRRPSRPMPYWPASSSGSTRGGGPRPRLPGGRPRRGLRPAARRWPSSSRRRRVRVCPLPGLDAHGGAPEPAPGSPGVRDPGDADRAARRASIGSSLLAEAFGGLPCGPGHPARLADVRCGRRPGGRLQPWCRGARVPAATWNKNARAGCCPARSRLPSRC